MLPVQRSFHTVVSHVQLPLKFTGIFLAEKLQDWDM